MSYTYATYAYVCFMDNIYVTLYIKSEFKWVVNLLKKIIYISFLDYTLITVNFAWKLMNLLSTILDALFISKTQFR